MIKRIAVAILLAIVATLCLNYGSDTRADQPIFGGIYSSYYVTTDKVLFLENTQGGGIQGGVVNAIAITVQYKMKCTDGRGGPSGILADNFTFTTSGATFEGAGKYFPCSGWLLSAGFSSGAANIVSGLVYSQLEILNTMPAGAGPNKSAAGLVASQIDANVVCDFLHANFAVTWPGQNCAPPSQGLQFTQPITVANPSAGANFTKVMDSGSHHRIINIQYTLVTSATAGNRFACVNFVNNSNVVGRSCARYAQQPSTTVIYNFSNATGGDTNCQFLGGTQTAVQCPEINVAIAQYWEMSGGQVGGFTINSSVLTELGAAGLAASDQISSIFIMETLTHDVD